MGQPSSSIQRRSMPRPTSTARPLSVTEELEKLEQSITLTLQEIDHNFSRAHRIVTSSILPIVEQYAEHSSAVWEGSKFWKQFFEASANVSLSGVEEQEEEEDASYTQSHGDASTYATSQQGDDTGHYKGHGIGDETELPSTPGAKPRIPDMSMTPMSSPFDPTSYLQSTVNRHPTDLLLHRVLDKNYRIQATPHTSRKEQKTPANKPSWRDTTSPMSSPPAAAPQLHAEIFSSPIRQQYSRPNNLPRTPGVSVQTPAKKQPISKTAKKDEISWESDSDEDAEGVYRELGMSPPKTIQFSLPQSRLLQTPAREASKRIVEDLLTTAGAAFDDTDGVEDSPSMVAVKDGLDDSF